jgi:hypothetical protein
MDGSSRVQKDKGLKGYMHGCLNITMYAVIDSHWSAETAVSLWSVILRNDYLGR